MKMKQPLRAIPLTHLLMVLVCAALAFGGSFTCNGSTHDNSSVTSNP